MKKFFYSEDNIALGLLVLRIGIGLAFILHGFPKLFLGGAAGLAKGLAATGIPGGIVGAYLAGIAEIVGGILLVLGLLTRPAGVVMAFNMLVALTFHLSKGDLFLTYSHAIESGIVFLALLISGAGKFSLDHLFWGEKTETSFVPHQRRQRSSMAWS